MLGTHPVKMKKEDKNGFFVAQQAVRKDRVEEDTQDADETDWKNLRRNLFILLY